MAGEKGPKKPKPQDKEPKEEAGQPEEEATKPPAPLPREELENLRRRLKKQFH